MSIPLPPGLGSTALRLPFNGAGVVLSLYDCLRESEAFLPMQFLFNINAVWKVDLSANAPRRPLQKISCLYIDALNSSHDAILFFPGTGWGIRIAAGTQFLVNDLVGKGDYVFYVSLSFQQMSSTDIINIFALNVNLPFFDTLWQYPQGKNNDDGGTSGSTWFFTDPDAPGPPPNTPVYGAIAFYGAAGVPVLTSNGNLGPPITLILSWQIINTPSLAGGGITYNFVIPTATLPNTPISGALNHIANGSCVTSLGPPIIGSPTVQTPPTFQNGTHYNDADGPITKPAVFISDVQYFLDAFCTIPA